MFLDRVDVDDALVANGGGGPRLTQEALTGRRGGGQFRGHHLDGDRPVQRLVERLQNDAAATPADECLELVMNLKLTDMT